MEHHFNFASKRPQQTVHLVLVPPHPAKRSLCGEGNMAVKREWTMKTRICFRCYKIALKKFPLIPYPIDNRQSTTPIDNG